MNNSIYKKSIEIMPIGYGYHKIILDENDIPCDYEFLEVNPAHQVCTGLVPSEILGKRVTDVLHGIKEEDFDWIKTYGDVALNGTDIEFERYTDRFDKWFRIRAVSPEKYYFITLITDITKEKKDFIKVASSEEKWKSYADSAPYAILVTDKSGNIIECNLETCYLSGYSETELLAMNIYTIWTSASNERDSQFLDKLVAEGRASSEVQFKTKNNGIRWFDVGARRLLDDRIIVYCNDITDRKKLEEDLTKSEQLYRTFIDASEDIIFLKDDELRYIIVNDALTQAQYFNRSKTEILGKTDAELLPEHEVNLYSDSDMQVLTTKSAQKSEARIDHWVFAANKFPVSIGNGKIGVGAFIRDVSIEKRQEAQIKRTMERHRILAETLLKTFNSKQEHLEYALQEALNITGSQYGYIFLYDESREELTLNSWTIGVMESCGVHDEQMKYRLEQTGLWGEVVRQRKPIIINDFEASNPMKKGYPAGHVVLKNFMSIPVIFDEKIVATVGLGNKNSGYDDNDVYELSMLMNGIFLEAEKREAQNRAEDLLAQTQSMFNEHDAVMLLFEPHSGAIVEANPAALNYYGYSKEEMLKLSADDISMQPKDAQAKSLADVLSGNKKNLAIPHRLKNGERRMVEVYACPISFHKKMLLYAIIFDVTEKEKAIKEIKYLSFNDHLTGLYNRRYFDLMLAVLNTERNMPLTLVMGDVNGLKLVNDSFGHMEGDKLLQKAAEVITEGCRKNDIVARIGGDEFAIILPNTDNVEANTIVKRIKTLQSTVNIKQLVLSLSFGFAVKNEAVSDMGVILSEAENLMYRNKMYESASIRNKTISIIMNTLFEKSRRELEHSNRVSAIAGAIAAAMHLDAEQVNQIEVAGLLHDIGKIGIDEQILNKPGRLDSFERQEIMKHPESGWRILSNSDEFSDIAEFILHHHEFFNGCGYPRKIKGEQIPLQSRIIAVADAYDAMTKDRPYRKGMSKNEAIAEINRNSGIQFDPEIVEIFIENVLSSGRDFEYSNESRLYQRIIKVKDRLVIDDTGD